MRICAVCSLRANVLLHAIGRAFRPPVPLMRHCMLKMVGLSM
jgi:hypothetical protein